MKWGRLAQLDQQLLLDKQPCRVQACPYSVNTNIMPIQCTGWSPCDQPVQHLCDKQRTCAVGMHAPTQRLKFQAHLLDAWERQQQCIYVLAGTASFRLGTMQ